MSNIRSANRRKQRALLTDRQKYNRKTDHAVRRLMKSLRLVNFQSDPGEVHTLPTREGWDKVSKIVRENEERQRATSAMRDLMVG